MTERELERQLLEWSKQYGRLEYSEIAGQEFIWRLLTRGEYKRLVAAEMEPADKEELVCQTCVLFPQDYDFSSCLAGIPTTLAREILEKSGFPYNGEPNPLGKKMLDTFRAEMDVIDNQIDCVIVEAFPRLTLEEVADWSLEKTMYYLSRAEWILHHLRGLPLVPVGQNSHKK
ncbi:hypothetical protein MTAT_20600 [Moorella thermoacetica]|uniref:Uncharacterized protein n=1 Tax=Neomoorella thermoacetica TaxID=1525 RepID=A0AAC9HIV6_NEOTH|nr:hypothetical protein [Moorella thermoacetica]AOQ24715.1 hypothetical protein Maut_02287 [Moorella thermoacetica]TYL12818.1 hypothetical protein MTAT_20600 [Moorella thermoacetica]